MAIVDFQINGRTHQIACDDGQESHVRSLAMELDIRVKEMGKRMGSQAAEGTLLAVTALMMADELHEVKQVNRSLKQQISNNSPALEKAKHQDIEMAVAHAINDIAEEIESFARAIEK